MNNFIVSARKYRPATFDSVIGQASITNTLKNAIRSNHLAQAFLFCGPRGVGKTTCARILAKTINCSNISENLEPCNKCESCASFNQSHSFNIHELDAASNNSVDDIRSLIDQVRIAPQVGNYSIYIIDEVHMLSVAAFNAFLKTLEEPPSYAVFILATTSKQKIIPTILSRCQIFDFSRIQVEDIAKHLESVASQEEVQADPDALHIIAQKADGSLRDALSIFDQMVSYGGKEVTYSDVIENLNILDYEFYFKAIDAILERSIPASLLLFDEVLNNGFDGHNYITGLSEHIRNLLVCKDEATLQLLQVGSKIRERYKAQAQACTAPMLLNALFLANKCDVTYNSSVNKRLQVELTLMQLCSLHGINEDHVPPVKIIPSSAEKADQVEEPKPEYRAGKRSGASVREFNKDESTPVRTGGAAQVKIEEKESVEEKSEELKEGAKTVSVDAKSPEDPADNGDTKQDVPSSATPSVEGAEDYKIQTRSLRDFAKSSGEAEKEAASVPQTTYGASQVSQEQVDEVWERYAKKIKDLGKHSLYSTMTKRKPVLGEQNTLLFDVDNSVQESEMNTEGSDIHEFLRKELDNGDIVIKVNVLRAQVDRKPYTSMEKFKRMAEKNPSIEKFRKQLNLDID